MTFRLCPLVDVSVAHGNKSSLKIGEFRGLGGAALDRQRLSGVQGPQAPAGGQAKGAGVKLRGRSPFAVLLPLIADFRF